MPKVPWYRRPEAGDPPGWVHPSAHLTVEQVREIRTEAAKGVPLAPLYRALAARFGVSVETIRTAADGRTHRGVA